MKNWLLLAAILVPTAGHADFGHAHDFHPNPRLVPDVRRPDTTPPPAGVLQSGEIVILEGDDTLVSSSSMGLGLGESNLPAITQRFYTRYGDDYDEIVVFTTFADNGAQGALAYEISTKQDVRSIGEVPFDDNATWGSGGRLRAFVNMMRWDQFEIVDIPSADARSDLYPTLGQEFAHAWAAFLRYNDAQGQLSSGMLGRDLAHWSSLLQADASVIDGNRIVDNGDGTFAIVETMDRYSMLDQYAMGLVPASAVQPCFLVKNATTMSGTPIAGTDPISVGAVIKGTREDIVIDQIIAAMGSRMPSDADSPHAFRVAFVLVTSPGQGAGDVLDAARTLDQVRETWEQVFSAYTGGNGTMCTQVSAPCGTAFASVVGGAIREMGGNHNGVVEPGEPIAIDFTLANAGKTDVAAVAVSASGDAIAMPQQATANVAATTQTTVTFSGVVPKDATCAQPVVVQAQAVAGGVTSRGLAAVVVGRADAVADDFESDDGGFHVAPDSAANGWEWGTPVEYKGKSGFVYQPAVGAGGSAKMWFTGLAEGHRAMGDSSLAVGASTLLSDTIDLSKTVQPTLRYAAWFQAIDFTNPNSPALPTDVALTVDASADRGQTWVPIDRVDQTDERWQPRSLSLAGRVPADAKIQLRFVVSNPSAAYQLEAGIDDVVVETLTPACAAHDRDGCSCGIGAHVEGATTPRWTAALLVLLFAARCARRRGWVRAEKSEAGDRT